MLAQLSVQISSSDDSLLESAASRGLSALLTRAGEASASPVTPESERDATDSKAHRLQGKASTIKGESRTLLMGSLQPSPSLQRPPWLSYSRGMSITWFPL